MTSSHKVMPMLHTSKWGLAMILLSASSMRNLLKSEV